MDPARRVALVTGSSRGLGRFIAARLAADGLGVAVNGSDDERTRAAAASIPKAEALRRALRETSRTRPRCASLSPRSAIASDR